MQDRPSLDTLQLCHPCSCPIRSYFTPVWVDTPVWMDLVASPATSASEQALLLVSCSEVEWLAWIPDYGEIQLHISQFYGPHSWN